MKDISKKQNIKAKIHCSSSSSFAFLTCLFRFSFVFNLCKHSCVLHKGTLKKDFKIERLKS